MVKSTLECGSEAAIHWFENNNMQANAEKFQVTLFTRETITDFSVNVNGNVLKSESCVKLLGMLIDDKLTFDPHVSNICKRAIGQLKTMYRLPKVLSIDCRLKMYSAFIISNFMYCNLVWHTCSKSSTRKVEHVQERSLRYVYEDYNSSFTELLVKANKSSLYMARLRKLVQWVYCILHKMLPPFLHEMFVPHNVPYNLRDNQKVMLYKYNTVTHGKKSLSYEGAKLYNDLPVHIKMCDDYEDFIKNVKLWNGSTCICGECFICKCTIPNIF